MTEDQPVRPGGADRAAPFLTMVIPAFNEERRLFGKINGKWFERKFKAIEEFHLELDHFAECIRKNRTPGPDGLAGARDVQIIQAIYQSVASNQPVAIPSAG